MNAKQKVSDLALFGGRPAFEEKLHIGRPNIGDRERFLERVGDILDRRWLTNNGRYVQEFEQALTERLQVQNAVAICNGTVALELAIRALGLKGEVIVPSFTFVATAHALQWQKITPVFCDVDPATHNINPQLVESLITPRTTGIIGVHVWGIPCDIEALEKIADRHNLKLMFDSAHAFACSHKGRMLGGFGHAEVLSFHATKFFNTLEGGAITTNDGDLAAKIRLMKNFGFAGYDKVIYIGTNGKMNEVSAAMGLTGLESLASFIETNHRNYRQYQQEMDGLPGVRTVRFDEREKNNYQYIILEIDADAAGLSRDDLMNVLWAENVLVRRYFYPGCHCMEPYRTLFPDAGARLPETEKLCRRVLSLPTGLSIGKDEIGAIGSIIRTALSHGPEIHSHIQKQAGG